MSASILTLAAVAVALSASPSHAQKAAKLSWGPAPPAFPAGAKMAVVSGDPSKAGPFAVQLSMPNRYRIAPHFHPTDENVTVKSGHFLYGMGDTVNRKAMKAMKPGQSGTMPANTHHYAMAQGRTVVEVSAQGPFVLTYVNAADDPRTKK
jgi:quercetin dioxygenase-like cupin family protein